MQRSNWYSRTGVLSVSILAMMGWAAGQAAATWSIILVDTETREIAVGSATCLTGFDLRANTPVMITGVGAATAQGLVDTGGGFRMQIHDLMLLYQMHPEDIIDTIQYGSNFQRRQFGIVDALGRTATFTGDDTGPWSGGRTGQFGTIAYAVQGNVLTGQPVVDAAIDALELTPGDLADKLMVSMEAAYTMGGDGRCSCAPGDPEGCGAPPPDFEKSAHIGYMLISRLGDEDGPCDQNGGCARGDYYLNLNVANQQADDPDPVIQLRGMYDQWRDALVGRPDGLLSTATVDTPYLPADGTSKATLTISLVDVDGGDVTAPIESIEVTISDTSDGVVFIGTPMLVGDDVYEVELSAGTESGIDELIVRIDDGVRPVQITPAPQVTVRTPGDVNADGFVDLIDLGIVLASFELEPGDANYDERADLNGDGAVDLSDLAIVLANFTG
jgi:hypothetical protein